ncbi:MAG: DNA polymerase III subunit delta [Bacteroidales bacterium]
MTFEQLITSLKQKKFSPIYLLMGEEPYYIDLLCDEITENALSEADKAFNQMVIYSQKDMNLAPVIDGARRYPMMAERQVVVLKEAQLVDLEPFTAYFEKPQPSTILVICVKYKKVDKRLKFYKAAEKQGVVFESTKVPDYKMPDWILQYAKQHQLHITQEAAVMLSEFLGNDLSKVVGEIDKLRLTLPEGNPKITPLHVERNTGYSKDYNIFELQRAIVNHDVLKANRIVQYFEHNPKAGSLFAATGVLFSFFVKVFAWHFMNNKSPQVAAAALGYKNTFAIKEIEAAAKRFPPKRISAIFSLLRTYDARAKGVMGTSISSPPELFREMLFRIMH